MLTCTINQGKKGYPSIAKDVWPKPFLCTINNKQFLLLIQQYKEESYNFFRHHSQNLEYQQKYPKIISRDPQLLVTKCCIPLI
jgi:hypothetical protein